MIIIYQYPYDKYHFLVLELFGELSRHNETTSRHSTFSMYCLPCHAKRYHAKRTHAKGAQDNSDHAKRDHAKRDHAKRAHAK